MRKLDPRTMLFIAACFSTLGVVIQNVQVLAVVFVAIILFAIYLGAKLDVLLRRVKGLVTVVVFVALMESIFVSSGRALLSVFGVRILTYDGLIKGLSTLLRIGCVIGSASIFTLSTSREMIQGLIQIRIPYEIAFMASVALRFLPVFSSEFRDTLVAIQLRGVDINKIPIREKIGMMTKLIMPVTFSAVDRAKKLSNAMELRGFRAYNRRTSIIKLEMKAHDYIYMLVILVFSIGILYWYKGGMI